MTRDTFMVHIGRMQANWGSQHYREPRVALLWRAFQGVDDAAFSAAVDRLIAYQRSAPMVPEIEKALEMAKLELIQAAARGNGSPLSVMVDAARVTPADPEFVKGCVKLVRDKFARRLTAEQWEQGVQLIQGVADRICPKERPVRGPQRDWKKNQAGEA